MLRDFIKNAVIATTDCVLTQKRITRSILLDFDYELNNPNSEFGMSSEDFIRPRGRMEHLFLYKYLPQVDEKKVNRFEDYLNLYALKSYKIKYKTTDFDEEIMRTEATIQSEPIVEIDSLAISTSSEKSEPDTFWMP